ncbi:MAG: metallophosphoesterase [Oscillospiraceae bacterium]|nr:metallophosphoesterase [Oscillospiraceae bacterium]
MQIIVMSDTHGAAPAAERVLRMHEDADLIVHLGDGEREMSRFLDTMPWLEDKLQYLKGNCDTGQLIYRTHRTFTQSLPYGHRLFAAHGDAFQVKFGTARIVYEARKAGADIVLYGHTHVRESRFEDGMYIVNPGSLGWPRDGQAPGYALIDILPTGVLVSLAKL